MKTMSRKAMILMALMLAAATAATAATAFAGQVPPQNAVEKQVIWAINIASDAALRVKVRSLSIPRIVIKTPLRALPVRN